MAHSFSWARLSGSAPATGLGLDIGNTALRLVVLSRRRGQGLQLDRCASLQLPEGTVVDGRIQDPAQLGLHIAELLQHSRCSLERVALALPAQAVMCRHVTPATPHALHAAMIAEAGRYLNVAAADVCVDYHVNHYTDHHAKRHGDRHVDRHVDRHANDPVDHAPPDAPGVLLAAARREQVDERLAAVAAAGLKATVLDIDLYAAYAAITADAATGAQAGRPACGALLMVEPSHSRLALFDRRQMLFQRELPGSGELSPIDASPTLALAAGRALALADVQPIHLYLGGMAASQTMLAERIAQHSGVLCMVADPFAGMACDPNVQPCAPDERAAYLVACGLALRLVTP